MDAFEITIRDEVVWSRLETGRYPPIGYIRQRVEAIVRSEAYGEFMEIAQAKNMFQFLEKVELQTEEPCATGVKDMISEKLYREYKLAEMRYQMKKFMQTEITKHTKIIITLQNDDVVKQQKKQIIDNLGVTLKKVVKDKQSHYQKIHQQKDQILRLVSMDLLGRVQAAIQAIQKSKNAKELMMQSLREEFLKRYEVEKLYTNEVYKKKRKIMEVLHEYFEMAVDEKKQEIKRIEDEAEYYRKQERAKQIKNMNIEDVLMLDEDVDPEQIMEILSKNQIKSKFNFGNQLGKHLLGKVNQFMQQDNIYCSELDSKNPLDQKSGQNSITDQQTIKKNALHKSMQYTQSEFMNGSDDQNIQNDVCSISPAEHSQISNSAAVKMFPSQHKSYLMSSTRISEIDIMDSDQEEDENEYEKAIENEIFFDNFHKLADIQTWNFQIPPPSRGLVQLDEIDSVIANFQRNNLIMQHFTILMMRHKIGFMLKQKSIQEEHMDDWIDIAIDHAATSYRYGYLKIQIGHKLNLLTKELKIKDETTGKDVNMQYDVQINSEKKKSKYQVDKNPYYNLKTYDFWNWGWLANQYMEKNDYRIPSWTKVQGCIIKELATMYHEEKEQILMKNPQKNPEQVNNEIKELMTMKLELWKQIFDHLDLPKDQKQPITDREFKDPKSKSVKSIFFLYSMDTFLYGRLNWAAREKVDSCINNLGCFAVILSRALDFASRYREDSIDKIVVYRGLDLSPEQINQFQKGQLMNLAGYASTSKIFDESLNFAMKKYNTPGRKSTMFYIELPNGTQDGFCFQMNEKCYTKFPEESEILLDDGRPFLVTEVRKDTLVLQEPHLGKRVTKIFLRSMLPRNINSSKVGRLQTCCTLKEFYLNNYTDKIKERPPQFLCFFQSERKDVQMKDEQSILMLNKLNSYSGQRIGYKAAVSTELHHADQIHFEKCERIPGRATSKFLGHTSFRIYVTRYYPNIKKFQSSKPIQRYLSVDPIQCRSSDGNHDIMYASFNNDKDRANIWSFELLKSNSKNALYVIVNRIWMWDRIDKTSEEGWIAYENCSYLAIKYHGPKYKLKNYKKNENANYIYITKDKNEAAVWRWSEFPEELKEKQIEINLPLDINNICKTDWVYKNPQLNFTFNNVTTFPVISFQADSTFKYKEKMITGSEDINEEGFVVRPQVQFERISEGTWQFITKNQEQFLELSFQNELIDQRDKKLGRGKVLLQMDHNSHQRYICRQSKSYRLVTGFKLFKNNILDYMEKMTLSQSSIIQDKNGREKLLQLLPKGMRFIKYLFRCQKMDDDEMDINEFVSNFQKACFQQQTFILVQSDDNQIFGGYTEIIWTSDVSAPKKSKNQNSFIFGLDPDDQSSMNFKKYPVVEDQYETFHSNEWGANFIDLRFSSPDGESQFRPFGKKNYRIDDPQMVSLSPKIGNDGYVRFKYKTMEVFAVRNERESQLQAQIMSTCQHSMSSYITKDLKSNIKKQIQRIKIGQMIDEKMRDVQSLNSITTYNQRTKSPSFVDTNED